MLLKKPAAPAVVLTDIIFAASFLIMPFLTSALRNAADGSEVFLHRIGIFGIFLYPAACVFMLQRMAAGRAEREGLAFLQGFLWGRFTWPLGILFWAGLLFHGVAMAMIYTWGEMLYGTEIHARVTLVDDVVAWTGVAVFFAVSAWLVVKMWELDLARPFRELKESFTDEKTTTGWKIFMAAWTVILFPVVLVLGVAVVMVIPFYLYCLIWGYSLSRASKGKRAVSPLPDTGSVRIAGALVLAVYTVLLAYFFDTGVAHMVGISRQGDGYMPYWIASVMAMAMYYFPFRAFFGLSNRRSAIGWAIFAVSVALVFLETYRRFSH